MSVKSPRESAIEAELCRRVEAAGGLCEKVRVNGRRGFFDRLVVLPNGAVPRIIFVECKRPRRGRIAAHQIWYAQRFGTLGCEVALIKNWVDIDKLMKP